MYGTNLCCSARIYLLIIIIYSIFFPVATVISSIFILIFFSLWDFNFYFYLSGIHGTSSLGNTTFPLVLSSFCSAAQVFLRSVGSCSTRRGKFFLNLIFFFFFSHVLLIEMQLWMQSMLIDLNSGCSGRDVISFWHSVEGPINCRCFHLVFVSQPAFSVYG